MAWRQKCRFSAHREGARQDFEESKILIYQNLDKTGAFFLKNLMKSLAFLWERFNRCTLSVTDT